MYIDENMTNEEKINAISEQSHKKGFELYNKCQNCNFLTNNQKENISISLCIAYSKQILDDYVSGFGSGTFTIGFGIGDVKAVADIASKIKSSNEDESEFVS